ncbi:MAG: hypothetical protein MRZ79_20580 [Bacteroidia bacterium]|nr:hypothetical protein [Bacteroidia bacterium]
MKRENYYFGRNDFDRAIREFQDEKVAARECKLPPSLTSSGLKNGVQLS